MSVGWSLCGDQKQTQFLGRPAHVHPGAVIPFKVVDWRVKNATEYGPWIAKHKDLYVGEYACRPISGFGGAVTSANHSEHAHSIAVDINPESNPMNDNGVLQTNFDQFGIDDGYRFIAAFLRAGFKWGGGWITKTSLIKPTLRRNGQDISTGRIDTMHFELNLSAVEVQNHNWAGLLKAWGAKDPERLLKGWK